MLQAQSKPADIHKTQVQRKEHSGRRKPQHNQREGLAEQLYRVEDRTRQYIRHGANKGFNLLIKSHCPGRSAQKRLAAVQRDALAVNVVSTILAQQGNETANILFTVTHATLRDLR